jgi:hypothetical protein
MDASNRISAVEEGPAAHETSGMSVDGMFSLITPLGFDYAEEN